MSDKEDDFIVPSIRIAKGFLESGDWYTVTQSFDGKQITIKKTLSRSKKKGPYIGPMKYQSEVEEHDKLRTYQCGRDSFISTTQEKNKAYSKESKILIIQERLSEINFLTLNHNSREVCGDTWEDFYEPFHIIWDDPEFHEIEDDGFYAFDKMCFFYSGTNDEEPTEKEIALSLDTIRKTVPFYKLLLEEILLSDTTIAPARPEYIQELITQNRLYPDGKRVMKSLEDVLDYLSTVMDPIPARFIKETFLQSSGKSYSLKHIQDIIAGRK